jgi:hypothetical protein
MEIAIDLDLFQCAAALSMMPASAPSCWAQGVTAASYTEYAIWVSPSCGIDTREPHGEMFHWPSVAHLAANYGTD